MQGGERVDRNQTGKLLVGTDRAISRRGFLSAALAGSAVHVQGQSAFRRPNIIFILADDLGYGDFGCYGQQKIQTPNIDALAANGIRFTNHYAGNACCAPSRCALMTGLHTGHSPIRWNKSVSPFGVLPLSHEVPTVAELLKKTGYATGMTGRWHLGGTKSKSQPFQRGFDYYFGALNEGMVPNVAGYYFRSYLFEGKKKYPLKGNENGERKLYDQDLLTEKAEAYIREHKAGPFFLYMPYTIAHEPLMAPGLGLYQHRPWPDSAKTYAAMVTRLDFYVGRVVNLVKELGIERDTLIFFSSDNGADDLDQGRDPAVFDCNGPLRGYKFDPYEGGIRIPLVASWPGTIQPGTTADHPSAFWDFVPTVCELAGAAMPDRCDGISYLPTLLGKVQKRHEYLYWENHGKRKALVLRRGPWKLIDFVGEGRAELFDLDADIGETENLASKHPKIVRELRALAKGARTPNELFPLPERAA